MADQAPVNWPTCDQDGCIGVRVGSGATCLAHADAKERDTELQRIGESGEIDLRGVSITGDLLHRVMAAAPHDANQSPLLNTCRFDGATFQGDAEFDGATFQGHTEFDGATFQGHAEFDGATFQGYAVFDGVDFQGDAGFGQATFQGYAVFHGVDFQGDAGFDGATFQRYAVFDGATFHSAAEFFGATFQRRTGFGGATFQGRTGFGGATFHGEAGFNDATFHGDAVFNEATFQGDAGFGQATFRGNAGFVAAKFQGDAEFSKATFQGDAMFWNTVFRGGAGFEYATFQGDAGFPATFHGGAGFERATFKSSAVFDGATFQDAVLFLEATFKDNAVFRRATFEGDAVFERATFQGDADFEDVEFWHDARFTSVSFDGTRQFGPLVAHRGLVLDDARFGQPVQIEASTTGMCCRRARFPGGVQFRLRWARVVLDDADFPAPAILTGIPGLSSDHLSGREKRIAQAWQRLLAGEISERPQLLSLQRANVTSLGLSNIDVTDCRFAGAHNLDKLRLEADVSFAAAPSRAGRLSQGGWRQVIAEERVWRANRSRRWAPPWRPRWLNEPEPEVLDPGQIAGLYRSLRKGREDIKDEPGAADFYYGEMEMRRRAHRPRGSGTRSVKGSSWGRVERNILTAYWLVSGYGLRAWRALVWLAVITAALALAFHLVGFIRPPNPDTYWTSLLYAFRATLSLTDPEITLTAWGKLLQAVLRLTGPVLLGLAILALRGRVKR